MKISISAKCSDLCYTEVFDEQGNTILEHDGYAPYIDAIDGGDYVSIDIDNETGKIIGWKPLTVEDIKIALQLEDEEDEEDEDNDW